MADIAAAVSLRPGTTATPEEILAFCREHIADNKLPRTLVIMAELPLNANGKILKKDLVGPLTEAAEARRKTA